jgi:hypothetical protein
MALFRAHTFIPQHSFQHRLRSENGPEQIRTHLLQVRSIIVECGVRNDVGNRWVDIDLV